jgi:hypothetical protein
VVQVGFGTIAKPKYRAAVHPQFVCVVAASGNTTNNNNIKTLTTVAVFE